MRESIETPQVFRFGIFEVDGRARELRKQGTRVKLQDQPFQVLKFLLERAGDVVTRDELRQRVWPSNVYVDFDHGLNNAIARLREVLGDAPGTPRFIETLPRLGYRFIHAVEGGSVSKPVIVPEAPVQQKAEPRAPIAAAAGHPQWRGLTAGLSAVIAALLLGGLWLARRSANETAPVSLPLEASIAVLPFASMNDDVEQQQLAEGLSEELLNKLASIRGLKVIGRTSSFSFKDKHVTPAAIAKILHVNHLLEGSVRHTGSRVQVNAQLIEAPNGHPLWSQTYDREFTDIFQVQEDIAHSVATALQVKIADADEIHLRRRGTRDAEAYRLYLTGVTLSRGHLVARDKTAAKKFFEEALARDPTFAAAQAGIAMYYFRGVWTDFDAPEGDVALGRAAAERAVALDPQASDAFVTRANFESWQYRFRGDTQAYSRAQADYRRAIELDPSSSFAFFNYGRAVEWTEPDLAMRLFERTADVDPLWDSALARNASLLSRRGMHEAALKRLEALNEQASGALSFGLAILHRSLGRLDEAMKWLSRAGPIEEVLAVWSVHLSLGDRVAALKDLQALRGTALAESLREPALMSMDGRFEAAFESLDRHRDNYPVTRLLDLPTARFALITGHAARAREILESRLPDLRTGKDVISARNVVPALDLAEACAATGDPATAHQLINRVAAFLDGADAPQLPMFTYFRARAHALANERELALQTLDRAYDEGFRLLWALDLNPQPEFYIDPIDADPAFTLLRADPRFKNWRERIRDDNARQLKQLGTRTGAH